MYGTDYEYAHSRLEGTVVRYEGLPVQVVSVGPTGICTLFSLKEDDFIKCGLDELDFKP